MIVPHDVHAESIQTKSFDHLDAMLPILYWDARVVNFTCEQLARNSLHLFWLLCYAEGNADNQHKWNQCSSHLTLYYDMNISYYTCKQIMLLLLLLVFMKDIAEQTCDFVDFYCNPERPNTLVALKEANLIKGISLRVQQVWLHDSQSKCQSTIETLKQCFNLEIQLIDTLNGCMRLIEDEATKAYQVIFSQLKYAEQLMKRTAHQVQVQKLIYYNILDKNDNKQTTSLLNSLVQKHGVKNLHIAQDILQLQSIIRSGSKNINFVAFQDQFDRSDIQTLNIQAMLNQELDRGIMIEKFIELFLLNTPDKDKQEVQKIADKYREYKHDVMPEQQILNLYTKDGPFHKFINNSLRILINPVQIFYFWIVFYDMFAAIIKTHQHQKQEGKHSRSFVCYRGATVSEYQLNYLRNATGKHLECLGFLSTSQNRSSAQSFATNSLFQIHVIDVKRTNSSDFKYAFLKELSQHSSEKEVLFNPLNSFKVEQIRTQGKLTIISLIYGKLAQVQYQMKYDCIQEQDKKLANIIEYKNNAVKIHAINQGQAGSLKYDIGLFSRFPYLSNVAVDFYKHSIFMISSLKGMSFQNWQDLILAQYYLAEVFKLRRQYELSLHYALSCSQMHLKAMLLCLSVYLTVGPYLNEHDQLIEVVLPAMRKQVIIFKFTGRLYMSMQCRNDAINYFTDILKLADFMVLLGEYKPLEQTRLQCIHSLIEIYQKQGNNYKVAEYIRQGEEIYQLLAPTNFTRRTFQFTARMLTRTDFMTESIDTSQLFGLKRGNFAILQALAENSMASTKQHFHKFINLEEIAGPDGQVQDDIRLLRIARYLELGDQLQLQQIVQMSVDVASLSDKNMKYYSSPHYRRCLYQLAHLYTYKLNEFYFALHYLKCLMQLQIQSGALEDELYVKSLVIQAEIYAGYHILDQVKKFQFRLNKIQLKHPNIPNIGHLIEKIKLIIQFQTCISKLIQENLMSEMRMIMYGKIRRISSQLRKINYQLITIVQFFKVFQKFVPGQNFRIRSRIYEQIICKQFFNVITRI